MSNDVDVGSGSGASSLLERALDLASRGYFIFPCEPGGKVPLVEGGFHAGTIDPDQIRKWWKLWPEANPAISTGPSDLVVIDCDAAKPNKDDTDGQESLAELEFEHGLLPETFRVRTPSGGLHVYLSGAEGVPQSARKVGPGIDVRAATGYVLAPGARINGHTYEPLGAIPDPFEVPELPAWLRQCATRGSGPTEKEANRDDWLCEPDLPINIERAKRYLQQEVQAGRVSIEGHGGSDWLYKTCVLLRDFGISAEGRVKVLQESGWNSACVPPWPISGEQSLTSHAHHAEFYANQPAGLNAVRTESLDRMVEMAQDDNPQAADPPVPESPSRFKPLDWDGLNSLPPPTWMIDRTIAERSLVMMYGAWGSYKSFVALDMALSLASGQQWQEHDVRKPYTVVYVAGEGAFGIRQRAQAWAKHHGLDKVANFHLIPAMPMFLNETDLSDFLQQLDGVKPDFLVIDTTAHAMAGGDENSQQDAGLYLYNLGRIRDLFKCTVLNIHHTGKDEKKGARGSTAIPAGSDTLFNVKAYGRAAVVEMVKQKDAATWENKLHLNSREVADSLVFEVSRTATDPVTSAEVEADSRRRAEQADTMEKAQWRDAALEILQQTFEDPTITRISTTQLAGYVATEVGADRSTVRGWLRQSAWRTRWGLEPFARIEPGRSTCESWGPAIDESAGDGSGEPEEGDTS